MIFNMTGGGASLNFQVKTYPSETEMKADKPKENTIGVITTTTMTSWVFSAKEPIEPKVGMVWILVGTSSVTEFNAIKSKTLMVYPLSAKQYEGGRWVDKIAYIYQNGEWVFLATAPTNGLVAEYTFAEFSGNTIPDTSPNGYDLTLTNVTQDAGIVGKAGSFAGNSSAVANVRIVPDGMNGFSGLTISFWMKTQMSDGYGTVVNQDNLYTGMSVQWFGAEGSLYATNGLENSGIYIETRDLANGKWHHVCLVYNYSNSVLQTWVDGQKGATATCGKFTTSNGNFTIGSNAIGKYYYIGSLDQIRFYNRALSDDEVATLWNGGKGC